MPREIKFRAWDGRRFVYFSLFHGTEDERFHGSYDMDGVAPSVPKSEVRDVQQFTGLRDTHGKEIYEGDVLVRFNHDEESQDEHLVVEWDANTASFVLVHTKDDGRKSWINMKTSLDANMGVIGNIYENPELIKH